MLFSLTDYLSVGTLHHMCELLLAYSMLYIAEYVLRMRHVLYPC